MENIMDIRVFDLPTRDDDPTTIERCLRELENKARYGVKLDEIEIDWMDTANTWLIAEWSKV
jgi:hypothetical protein